SVELRDPTPWREEPTTIAALELDGTTYTRGAVIGEWTRAGPGRDDPAAVSKLVDALAAPRAPPHPPAGALRHTLTLPVRPPRGAPGRTPLRRGDPGPAPRTARTGDAPGAAAPRVSLPTEICALARALAR